MRLSAKQRRVLELLASDRRDASKEALVFVQQFDRDTIAGLVRTGLATTQRVILKAGDKAVEVAHITITKAGRQPIEGEGRVRLALRSQLRSLPRAIPGVFCLRSVCITCKRTHSLTRDDEFSQVRRGVPQEAVLGRDHDGGAT